LIESTIKTYSGLSTDTKPTVAGGVDVPNGSRFREVDTQYIYIYNRFDDTWYLVNQSVNSGSNYFEDLARGLIPGKNTPSINGGNNPNVLAGVESTIWEQGGRYTYLTADTPIYISSTDAGDDQFWLLAYYDEAGDIFGGLVQANGQNQVLVTSNAYRIAGCFNFGATDNAGDIYFAESDTLSGGKPITDTKIQLKVPIGNNGGSNATYYAGNDVEPYFFQFIGSVGKSKDAIIYINLRPNPDFPFFKFVSKQIYQAEFSVFSEVGFTGFPGSDIEVTVLSNDADTPVNILFTAIEKYI
jgi:hypothetical protein